MKKLLIILLVSFLLAGCNVNDYDKESKIKEYVNENVEEQYQQSEKNENDIYSEIIVNKDNMIIDYFGSIKSEISELLTKVNLEVYKTKIKQNFIILADFLFYDGEIKGIKLSELKDKTKEILYKIFNTIDDNIIKVWPDYKEEITNNSNRVYTDIKEKIISGLDYIRSKLNETLGEEAIDKAQKNLGKIGEFLKDQVDYVKESIKRWYENLKEN